jgi:predicted TIM-barrel fold metal-dependent hydrolase
MKSRYFFSTILLLILIDAQGQDGKLPIIDMHQHAQNKMWRTPTGEPLSRICMPEPCEHVPAKFKKDEDVLTFTLEGIKKYNIVRAVISNIDLDFQVVKYWASKAPEVFMSGYSFSHPINLNIEVLRREIKNGNVKILGEVLTQYSGMSADDPALEPFFNLAEEYDIPIQIHTCGSGDPSSKTFSIKAGNPLNLENVMKRHPNLRIYLENAGWPYVSELAALMYRYPNVYADLSTYTWIFPRTTFYKHLKELVDMGLGKRLMYGSDQMIWPEAIDLSIESINSADFLTPEQKRDIFYNNAARFLRLNKEEIEKDHRKK